MKAASANLIALLGSVKVYAMEDLYTFTLVDANGNQQAMGQSFDACIVDIAEMVAKRYYENEYTPGSNDPPTCFSLNGKTGSLPRTEKNLYGDCATCAFSQWGTATKNGKPSRSAGCF